MVGDTVKFVLTKQEQTTIKNFTKIIDKIINKSNKYAEKDLELILDNPEDEELIQLATRSLDWLYVLMLTKKYRVPCN